MSGRTPGQKAVSKELLSAAKKADKLGFNQSAFTLVLCLDRKTAKCCQAKAMEAAWDQIKQRCKQWKKSEPGTIIRIKSACVDICKGGPIVGVLPDGIWYGGCVPAVIDRIFDEHLKGGCPLKDHVIACPRWSALSGLHQ